MQAELSAVEKQVTQTLNAKPSAIDGQHAYKYLERNLIL